MRCTKHGHHTRLTERHECVDEIKSKGQRPPRASQAATPARRGSVASGCRSEGSTHERDVESTLVLYRCCGSVHVAPEDASVLVVVVGAALVLIRAPVVQRLPKDGAKEQPPSSMYQMTCITSNAVSSEPHAQYLVASRRRQGAEVRPQVKGAVAQLGTGGVPAREGRAGRGSEAVHAVGARRGDDLARPIPHPLPHDSDGVEVEARVRPHAEGGGKGALNQEAAMPPLKLEVVSHLEEVDDDVGGVVEEDDRRADANKVEAVGEGEEGDRHEVVHVHHHVVLVPLLEEAVRGARHNPDCHLEEVQQVHRPLAVHLLVRVRRPERAVVVEPVLTAAVDEEDVRLERRHRRVDRQLPALVAELVSRLHLGDRIAEVRQRRAAQEGARVARDELDEPDQREERKACGGERSKRLRPSQRAAGGQRAGHKEHRKHGDHLEAKQRGQEAVRKRIDDDPA
eukprot:CAMPEP_0185424016 /NCGR_PEP_ID=MMETSP1365-20130426/12900_1 /TAXON_ID=38817 /ORGANISM="Gephyrocapsa oceanica, Strain RCC1303" /LENGTH=454 /DNA_ID=CAMNT_0028027905 /DNA_START=81 /DNA_END=1446 /DNA_ORIENTATION=+